MSNQVVFCQSCGADVTQLNNRIDERDACPRCGSEKRNFHVLLEGRAGVGVSNLEWKHTRPGWRRTPKSRKRPLAKGSSGRVKGKDGQFVDKVQLVDSQNDRYRELVTDLEGNVLRDIDEPLSEHISSQELRRRNEQNA